MADPADPDAEARAQPAPLSLEDVAAAALTIGAARGFAERAARLLAIVRTWADPAALLAFVRDPSAEAGLRALPELGFGHAAQGQERTLARLIDEAGPERLAAPWLIPPPPEVAGYRVKPLDSWLIPWSGPGSSGFVLLRGIAAPYPANLAPALALASQPVWALVAAPAAPVTSEASQPAARGQAEAAPVGPGDPALTRLQKLEAAAREVQALVDGLRQELRLEQERREAESAAQAAVREPAPAPGAAASEAEGAPHEPALRATVEALEQARRELVELREQCDALDRARGEAEIDRDQARGEAVSWRQQAEELRARVEGAPAPVPEAGAGVAAEALEAARRDAEALRGRVAELESAAESAQAEATALRERLGELERAGGEPAGAGEVASLRERLEAAKKAWAKAEGERDERQAAEQQALARAEEHKSQAEALRGQLEELRGRLSRLEGESASGEADRQALDGARQALRVSEGMLAGQTAELEAVRRQRSGLQEQLEAAERARAAAEAERDRARSEVNPLWATIESLQRQLQEEQARLAAGDAKLAETQAAHEQAQAQLAELRETAAAEGGASAAAGERAQRTEERAQRAERDAAALSERWESSVAALRAAYLALKRTPFVPPTLRLSFGAAQAALDLPEAPAQPAAAKPTRVLLLDRDTPSLEPLAAELEAEGLEVLVAHYADEAAFFLKTPEARQLTALVADVMAFRSDAELLERFRVWRLDMPALGLLVSYRAEDPAETERARRLPPALGAGHVPRPLMQAALTDAVAVAARRAARPTEALAAPPRPAKH